MREMGLDIDEGYCNIVNKNHVTVNTAEAGVFLAVLALLCGPQGTHKNNGGILGGFRALMGTPGAQDV